MSDMSDVLVVDDDLGIRETIAELLALEGIPHRTAPDGAAALAACRAARPAVILLDMMMPVLDGPGFCAALESEIGRAGTAIIAMTAATGAARFCKLCAADGMLPKPFDAEYLIDVVNQYLPKR